MTTTTKSTALKTFSKEVWIGWVSSMAEAYNMAIFSFVAPALAPLLFQNSSEWSALFFSYSLVLIGSCLLYPAGAIYYGLIGDRHGRQQICIYSTLGLAIATGLMGLIPFHTGWEYFLLLICLQHFFSGGEYHGSIVFSLEHSEQKQNALTSSFSCLAAVFGLLLANGLATLTIVLQNPFWIKICFLVGAISGLISYILKNKCQETPAFCSLQHNSLQEANWSSFIRQEWPKIVKTVSIIAFFSVSYSFIFIFLPLINIQDFAQEFSTFKSLMAYGFFLVLSGYIANKMGMQKTIQIGLISFSIVIIPAALFSKNLFFLQMILTPCACLVIGPIHSWLLDQFTISQRCRGIFLSAAIATCIFGGSTVPICLFIFEKFQSIPLCCLYPLIISLAAMRTLGTWGH